MIKSWYSKAIVLKKRYLEESLPLIFYKTKFLASLYYFLFSPAFRREQKAVLTGKAKYFGELKINKSNYFLLVRNIHRIEKGLLMKPRRSKFAKDYISETIDSYIGVFSNGRNEVSQMIWFTDVLNEYFSCVEKDDQLLFQFARFEEFKKENQEDDLPNHRSVSKIPYFRNEELKPKISYEDFYLLNKFRRSVRWFLNKPVPRHLIDKAILVACQAPSACNRQPFEYIIIDNPKDVAKISKIPMGTSGYSHSIQTFIVVVGNLDAYFSERDRHVMYIDASLANMSFMLALETLGLGSVPINWPDIENRERLMEISLNLGSHQRPIMCIGVGYPDPNGMVAYSEKRDLNQIRKFF